MATYTPNLNLKKPSGTDRVLVSDLNDNFDKLDQAYAGGGGQGGGSVKILGTYGTFDELRNSVTNPNVGDIYQVGKSAPYMLYLWNNGQWIPIGGLQGDSAYVWIKYAADQPDSDDDMKDTPDQFMGIYSGTSRTPPTNYSAYVWYKIRGEKGDASYVHIRYSDELPTKNADMKDTPSNWMGVLVDTKKQPSGVYTDYQWFKIKGETGNGIQEVTFNDEDYTLTIHLEDGSQYTTGSIRGKTGNGIESIKLNNDYTLTIAYTDGENYTTPSIRGEIGPVGPQGPVGKSYTILGHAYDTLQELEADILAPEVGDQYNVGKVPPYNVYRWTGRSWEDQGTIGSVTEFNVNGKTLDSQNRSIEINATDIPMSESEKTTVYEKIYGLKAVDVHAVPEDRTINGHALTKDVKLIAADVGARPDDWTPTPDEVGAIAADIPKAKLRAAAGMTFSLEGTVLTITVDE